MAKKPLYRAELMPAEAKAKLYKELEAWNNIAQALTKLADEEKNMRVALFEKYFQQSPGLEEGTNHIELGFGKCLTAEYRINRRIDEGELDAAIALGKVDRSLVADLFNYKPTLRIGEWKETTIEIRRKLADVVTEEPGTPGLKITTPKR